MVLLIHLVLSFFSILWTKSQCQKFPASRGLSRRGNLPRRERPLLAGNVKSQIKFKICGNEPHYNEPRYDKIPAVINILSGRSQQSVKTTDLSRNHGLL